MTPSIELGEDLFALGKVEDARDCFLSIVELEPYNSQALNDLGVVYLTLGEIDKAESFFLKAAGADPQSIDARLNLVNFYKEKGLPLDAVPHMEAIHQAFPDDSGIQNQLAELYFLVGKRDEAERILNNSRNIKLINLFIESVRKSLLHWRFADDLNLTERLEGLTSSILALIDGQDAKFPKARLVVQDEETGELISLEHLHDWFFNQEAESTKVGSYRKKQGRTLLPDENPDWKCFIDELYKQIQAEGPCLGDFTHTKIVFKKEVRLSQYDLDATLDYFKENIGPCDCHVFRWYAM